MNKKDLLIDLNLSEVVINKDGQELLGVLLPLSARSVYPLRQ